MAVKVFTNADIDFISASGAAGNWATVAAGWTSMEGDSGAVTGGTGDLLIVFGNAHDDGSLPTDIRFSNVRIEFDYSVTNVGGLSPETNLSAVFGSLVSGTDTQGPGTTTGHLVFDVNPTFFGGGSGGSRSDFFSGGALALDFARAPGGTATSTRLVVTNYTATLSYVSLSTGWIVKVDGLTNQTGSASAADLPDDTFLPAASQTGTIDLPIYDTAGAFIFVDGAAAVDVAGLPAGFTPDDAFSVWNLVGVSELGDTTEYALTGVFDFTRTNTGTPAEGTQMITELTGMTLTKLSGMVGSTILGTMTSSAVVGATRCAVNAQTGFPTPPDNTFYLQGFYTLVSPTFTSISPTSGTVSGNTLVTCFGTFLNDTMVVNFDGTPATVEMVNAAGTALTCRTPAHAAGLVDVEIVGVDTLTNAYTYVAILSITPNRGTIQGSTPVTIRGGGFTGATSVEFDGVPGTEFVVVSDTTITVVTPAHAAGAVDVEVLVGVGTLVGGYTYVAKGPLKLPPIPVTSPVAQAGSGSPIGGKDGQKATQDTMSLAHVRYQMALKKAVEDQSN